MFLNSYYLFAANTFGKVSLYKLSLFLSSHIFLNPFQVLTHFVATIPMETALIFSSFTIWGLLVAQMVKKLSVMQENLVHFLQVRRNGEWNVPRQYSCLNSMGRGAKQATVHKVTKETRHDRDFYFHFRSCQIRWSILLYQP